MKTHSIIYARTHDSARSKASKRYKKSSRKVSMIRLANGPKRKTMKPYAVWTMKRKA